jgi:hypothetical protein
MAEPSRDFVPRPAGPVPRGLQLNWDAEPARRFLLTFRPGLAEAFPQPVYLLQEGTPARQKTTWTLFISGLQIKCAIWLNRINYIPRLIMRYRYEHRTPLP